jgi:plasmid stabilization system protein ParE
MPPALLSDAALRDITEAHEWYAARSPVAAQRFLVALSTTLDAIEEDALLFRPIEADVRRAMLRSFPYAVYFRPALPDGWAVIGVLHDHREPVRWQERR